MAFLARLYAHEIDPDLLATLRVPALKAGLVAFEPGIEDLLDALDLHPGGLLSGAGDGGEKENGQDGKTAHGQRLYS